MSALNSMLLVSCYTLDHDAVSRVCGLKGQPVSDVVAQLLTPAYSQVADFLNQLRAEAQRLRDQQQAAAAQGRKLHRSADELAVQRTFAEQLGNSSAAPLRQQEAEIRAKIHATDQQAQASAEALKRLEQLIRQMDMSSTTLTGDVRTNAADDPWVLALRGQIVQGREEERVRLAREVHDGPAQVLANVLMGLEHAINLQTSQHPKLGDFLAELRTAARQGLHEVRGFIADLRPAALDQGFAHALADYIRNFQRLSKVNITVDLHQFPAHVPAEIEIVLYRVIQEALQNINKHAPTANVLIRSHLVGNQLTVSVRDDGPGFDPHEVVRRSGKESWGLTSMRERLTLVGGQFSIASRPGAGTEVTLRITV